MNKVLRCVMPRILTWTMLMATGWTAGALAAGAVATQRVASAYEQLMGVRFGDAVALPAAPALKPVPVPMFTGAYAIWGSASRDRSGHLWFGVSAYGVPLPSAHLFEYAPDTGELMDRGDVVSQLKRLGLYREGEGQAKIHTRVVQGADGYLYFASMDEDGEKTNGSRLPTWGGHLWRVKPGSSVWEHLLATKEALIAVAGSGSRIYALGYFDHVLYQFDTTTRRVRSIHVGALGGHISRNFAADEKGHVYVTRLAEDAMDATKMRTTLVEFDANLQQVAETPIAHYTQLRDDDSHGIVGVHYMADRSIVLTTDRGFLYRVVPRLNAAAQVLELGFFHPDGEAYVASLLTDDGRSHLMGASRRQWNGDNRYEWVVFDLATKKSVAMPLTLPLEGGLPMDGLLLYGSMARDNAGRGYIVGTWSRANRAYPVILRTQEGYLH